MATTTYPHGLDGIAWLRRHTSRDLFKVCLSHISRDIALIRQRYNLPDTEIQIFLTFPRKNRRQGRISYRIVCQNRMRTLLAHRVTFHLKDDQVIGIQWSAVSANVVPAVPAV